MSKTIDQRSRIFAIYAENLDLLHKSGLLNGLKLEFDQTYICPLCTRQFSSKDLDTALKNHLTLEDAPPKSLGGTANILTCKECNNIAGYKIDAHLQAGLRALDARKFLPGSEAKVKFIRGEEIVQGSIKVEGDGTIKAINSYKNNHAVKLDNYIKNISPKAGKNLLRIEFVKPNSNDRRLQVGLLKTAYLLAFEKFGYAFILDSIYDPVREQIENPDADIYPMQFWFTGPYTADQIGVHIVKNNGIECFMSFFSLNTSITRIFSAILPLKKNPILQIVAGFHAYLALNTGEAEFLRLNNPAGYLSNLDAIKELYKITEELRSRDQ